MMPLYLGASFLYMEDTTNPTPVTIEAPVMPAASTAAAAPEMKKTNKSWGALIVIFLILAVVVIGAFYAWGERVAQQADALPVPTETVN
ncbi:MAG: hypothetical protein AB203_03650 [Parcubacteria bacterium C7867-008]|nr:MAG: hypothetical protein AB203_03650 [Parcubacteria bacterium C7867-008]